MSEIDEKEIKSRFETISRFEPSSEVTARDLEQVRKKLAEQLSGQRPREQKIWRIIMKSKITKLAAAAVIIVAVIICINQFGGSIDGASVAFSQIKQAVEKVPWVHSVNKNSNLSDEGWLSFIHQIEINKKANGKITYEDYDKKIKYE